MPAAHTESSGQMKMEMTTVTGAGFVFVFAFLIIGAKLLQELLWEGEGSRIYY